MALFTPRAWVNQALGGTDTLDAASLTDLEQRVYSGAVADASLLYNVKQFGAKGDGTTDDTTAIRAAAAAVEAAGAGIVWFPKGIYPLSASGAYSVKMTTCSDITFQGEGWQSILQHTGTVSAVGHNMIEMATIGGIIRIRDLAMEGPTLSGDLADNTAVMHTSTTTGRIIFDNVYCHAFSYAMRSWAGGSHRLEAHNSNIVGGNYADSGTMGIHCPGGVGSEVICRNTDFSYTGKTSDHYHNHCIYLYEPVAYDIQGCRFDHVTGRFLQSYSGTGKPAYCRFTDCVFGSDIPSDTQGIMTNSQVPTIFTNCIFRAPGVMVQAQGDVIFDNCHYDSAAGTTYYPHILADLNNQRIVIRGGFWDTNQETIFKIPGGVTGVKLKIDGASFSTAYVNAVYSNGTSAYVEVSNCLFGGGTSGAGNEALYIDAAATLVTRGNRFASAGGVVNVADAAINLYAFNNDFSQAGSTLAGSAPSTKKYLGNVGSIGLADA